MFDKNTENVIEKKGAKHKPESRKRYEKKYPNWTVRMPLQWHKDYETYVKKLGLSRREFMGVALEKIKLDYEQIKTQSFNKGFAVGRKQGHQEGYAEGENIGYKKGREDGFEEGKKIGIDQGTSDCTIWYFCVLCGEPIYVKPGSEEHKMIINFFNHYTRAHTKCAQGRFYR